MDADWKKKAVSRPAIFHELGVVRYAGNCHDIVAASQEGKVAFHAWARHGYPGDDLGRALPQVCSVGGWDAAAAQEWRLREHANEGVEIAYLARGNLPLVLDGKRHEMTEGQFVVLRPWQMHGMGDPSVTASQLIWVLIDTDVRRPHDTWIWPDWIAWCRDDLRRLTQLVSQAEQSPTAASRDVARSFRDIYDIVAGGTPAENETRMRLAISGLLYNCLGQLESAALALDEEMTGSKRTVHIFLERLQNSLGADWTLASMAAQCDLSRTRFSQHCLTLTNMSPLRYLKTLRLEAARRSLMERSADASVTEIAFECGFSSSQYFATCYKERFGHQPQQTPIVGASDNPDAERPAA
ncbi:MAG: AraC family transcriptional regulator [Hyphomicrobiales bacterium]|nr:AraC family transcriptional regulator [Hyphomicrobiales bacterium]